jgi:hypothetical protein
MIPLLYRKLSFQIHSTPGSPNYVSVAKGILLEIYAAFKKALQKFLDLEDEKRVLLHSFP